MAGFNAKSYGTVTYNFEQYEKGLSGTVPDPSDDLLSQYFKEIREFFRETGLDDIPSERDMRLQPDQVRELVEKIDAVDRIEVHHKLLEIIARLCQNQPSVDDMMKLPYRVRVKFTRFVQTELTNPEA